MQTGPLIIRRPNQYPDRIRRYRVYVDGSLVGTLKAREELALNLPTGEHEIVARIDWCGSNTLRVNIRAEEATEIEVSSNAMKGAGFLALYYVTFGHSKYLTLRLASRGFSVFSTDTGARQVRAAADRGGGCTSPAVERRACSAPAARRTLSYPTMATDPHVETSFDGETSIEFPAEGVTTSVTLTKVGPALYRLDSVPLMVESVKFRDIVEADDMDGKKLRFRRVVQESNWRVFDFLLSKEDRDSEKIDRVLRRVERIGGHWERVLGGYLLICLPPEVDWNPTADVVG